MECLLFFVVAPFADDILRGAEPFYLGKPGLQQLRCVRRDLDQGVHIVVVLVRPVHLAFDVLSGIDGAVHLLIVCAGVVHVAHPAAAPHGGVGYLGQDLLPRAAVQGGGERNAVPQPCERRKPAAAHQAAVAVTCYVQIGVVHAVQFDVVPRGEIRGCRADQVHDAGGRMFFRFPAPFFPAPGVLFLFGIRFPIGSRRFFFGLCTGCLSRFRSRSKALLQHIPEADRQTDIRTGMLTQHAKDRFYHLVVNEIGFHDCKAAACQIASRVDRHLIHGFVPFHILIRPGSHVRLVLVSNEKPCSECAILDHVLYLPDVVRNTCAALRIFLMRHVIVHPPDVLLHVNRLGKAEDLYAAGRDAQPGGKAADDALPFLCILQEKIHGQDFE